MRKRLGQSLIVLLLAIGLFAVPRIYTAAAAGNLYVNPAIVAPQPVGSTFTVQVKVSGMDQLNGWEIQVVSDPSVISPTSISTAGNIFLTTTTGGIALELRNCVNGGGTGCCLTSSCAPLDGPGIADSAYGYTKPTSGSGLLFNVTFQVVSNGPYSPIIIQNDQFSNGGSFVAHSTTSAAYGSLSSISVSEFFTKVANFTPLRLDSNGNPSLKVLFEDGTVRSTKPGGILAWVNITNMGHTELQSLSLSNVLPIDWQLKPSWSNSPDAIHVYYANATSLDTNPEITDPSTITVSGSNPQTVSLNIPNLNNSEVGHPLFPGQSMLFAAEIGYGLKGTSQSMASYPRTYTDAASVTAWTGASYTGAQTTATGAASFVAHTKLLGDMSDDGCVDIFDMGLIMGAYGSTSGSSRWNDNADFFNDGSVGINDVTAALANYNSCA